MLLGLAMLVEHVHAAVAGDALAEVHDQIVFLKLEKAVDGPRFELAAG